MQNQPNNVERAELLDVSQGDDLRLMRAEVDIQVTTAKRFPRSVHEVVKRAEGMATITPATAASCFYKLPRKEDGRTKYIEGPSVRLAEILASAWGNLRVAGRVIGEDSRFVTAQGACFDCEANVAATQEVRRRITDRNNRRYSEDMIAMTANAAVSIAVRNAIIRVIPRVWVDQILLACKKVAVGDAKSLVTRRSDLLGYLKGKMAVSEERILAVLEREHVEDITLDDLETLHGLATSVRDGEVTLDEAFPPIKVDPPEGGKGEGQKQDQSREDRLAADLQREGSDQAPPGTGEPPFDADPDKPETPPPPANKGHRNAQAKSKGEADKQPDARQESGPKTGSLTWAVFYEQAREAAMTHNIDAIEFEAGIKRFRAGNGWVGKEKDADPDKMAAAVKAISEGRFDWNLGVVNRAQ